MKTTRCRAKSGCPVSWETRDSCARRQGFVCGNRLGPSAPPAQCRSEMPKSRPAPTRVPAGAPRARTPNPACASRRPALRHMGLPERSSAAARHSQRRIAAETVPKNLNALSIRNATHAFLEYDQKDGAVVWLPPPRSGESVRLAPTAFGSGTIHAPDPGTGPDGLRMRLTPPLIFTAQHRTAAMLDPTHAQLSLASSTRSCAPQAPRVAAAPLFLTTRRLFLAAVA